MEVVRTIVMWGGIYGMALALGWGLHRAFPPTPRVMDEDEWPEHPNNEGRG
jgi:hypothetical protein